MLTREILNEARNVVNVTQVETMIRTYLDAAVPSAAEPWPVIRNWLYRVTRQYILTEFIQAYRVYKISTDGPESVARLMHKQTGRQFFLPLASLPSWVEQRHQLRDELLWIEERDFNQWLAPRITRVIDWFRHLVQNRDPILTAQRLSRLTLQQAEVASRQWHEELRQRAEQEKALAPIAGEVPIMELSNGYRWVSLTTPEALDREGERMGHCVGSYAEEIEAGTEIYSLRDGRNAPHVTIEAETGTLEQVKGKGNEPPVEKYWPMVDHFIMAYGKKHELDLGREGAADLQGCGLVVYERPKRRGGGVTIVRTTTPLKDMRAIYREVDYVFDEDGSGNYEEVELANDEASYEDLTYLYGKYLDEYIDQMTVALIFQGWWRRTLEPYETEYEHTHLEISVYLQGLSNQGVPHKILYGREPDQAELE